MDTPLVPQGESKTKRTGINIIFFGSLLFFFVALLILAIEGRQDYKHAFIAVALAMLLVLVPTFFLLNSVRKDEQVSARIKYCTLAQTAALCFLAATQLIIVYTNLEGPAPAVCHLDALYQPNSQQCVPAAPTGAYAGCFVNAPNYSMTQICVKQNVTASILSLEDDDSTFLEF